MEPSIVSRKRALFLIAILIIDIILGLGYDYINQPLIDLKVATYHSRTTITIKLRVINYGRVEEENLTVEVNFSNLILLNKSGIIFYNSIAPLSARQCYILFQINKPGDAFINITLKSPTKTVIKFFIVKARYTSTLTITRLYVKEDHNWFGPGTFYIEVLWENHKKRFPKSGGIEIEGKHFRDVDWLVFDNYILWDNIQAIFKVYEEGIFSDYFLGAESFLLPFNASYLPLTVGKAIVYITIQTNLRILTITPI